MATQKAAIDKAAALIAEGLTILFQSILGESEKKADLEEDISKATSEQKATNAARNGKSTEKGPDPRVKEKSKQDDDEDDDETPAAKKGNAKALAALEALDMDNATRADLKEVADLFGLDTTGKKSAELKELLKAQQPKAGKGEKASKKKDEEEEVTYPSDAKMRKEFKMFAEANKKALKKEIDPDFFDEEDDADDPRLRLHQICADAELLREYWKDNVHELKEAGKWDELVESLE